MKTLKNRINIQTIGSYIRTGGDLIQVSFSNFKERRNTAYSKLEQQIIEICGTEKKNEILDCIGEYSSTVEEIYFNLGMKAGATLQVNLLNNFETDV